MSVTGLLMTVSAQALAPPDGSEGADTFFETDIGEAIVKLCGAIAVVIMLLGIFRMVRGMGRGRPVEAFRALGFGLVIGALLFNLSITVDAAQVVADLLKKLMESITEIGGLSKKE
ncbi:hypothetical protein [Actinomadura sp. B10D3]|uniref:hypothetical protein n=1 Tax=Actinomadura sp. B10D3 TaxID=3153557 RepID=UPI00325EB07E